MLSNTQFSWRTFCTSLRLFLSSLPSRPCNASGPTKAKQTHAGSPAPTITKKAPTARTKTPACPMALSREWFTAALAHQKTYPRPTAIRTAVACSALNSCLCTMLPERDAAYFPSHTQYGAGDAVVRPQTVQGLLP
ncbi:hypothetical protein B0J12DRAFT_144369 [Macrophomina phaseolina]|uniref:Secreted protein n=1 Tax=Macrophomina phaseolina TaxID=35725 RepID=A0ABQ8G8U1_9PEZI|nr:hypothetical protein B0J12DRAFT_144369 [Macrophomina phaseolina]